jgi:hypothetical protein
MRASLKKLVRVFQRASWQPLEVYADRDPRREFDFDT